MILSFSKLPYSSNTQWIYPISIYSAGAVSYVLLNQLKDVVEYVDHVYMVKSAHHSKITLDHYRAIRLLLAVAEHAAR